MLRRFEDIEVFVGGSFLLLHTVLYLRVSLVFVWFVIVMPDVIFIVELVIRWMIEYWNMNVVAIVQAAYFVQLMLWL